MAIQYGLQLYRDMLRRPPGRGRFSFHSTPMGAYRFDPHTGRAERISGTGERPAPPGYRWAADGRLEAIPGGPATRIQGEQAGRLAMLRTARGGLAEARRVFTQSWGPGGTLQQAIVPEFMSEWSGTVGRARRTITAAIEAALRAMTGAAAPDTEVRRYEDLFMPHAGDRPETVRQKLANLEAFMNNAENVIMQGRGPAGPPAPAGGGGGGFSIRRLD